MEDWIFNEEGWGWQNEEWLTNWMNGSDTFAKFYNATNDIALPGGGGGENIPHPIKNKICN